MYNQFKNIKSYRTRASLISLAQKKAFYSVKPSTLITMPSLSPSMETGKVVVWKVKPGDKIRAGDSIADVETDKATLSYDTTDDGYLAKILIEEGQLVPIGTPIAALCDSPDDVAKFADFKLEDSASKSTEAKKEEPKKEEPKKEEPKKEAPKSAEPEKAAQQTQQVSSDGSVRSSPYARTVAKELGVSLDAIKGTGPNGRIVAADVTEFKESGKTQIQRQTIAQPTGTQAPTFIDIPNQNIRRITAERLTYSKQNIPHYYLTMECKADKLLELRAQLNKDAKDYKLSINDFIIKASANALKAHPVVNSEWKGDFIRQYSNIDINVAVNSPKGLLVPMIKDANAIGLKGISNSVKDMAARAQEGKSTPMDLQMGTFSISNLGMFGISHFTAVINPPQAAILAVGNVDQKVELTPDGPKSVSVINVTLSCDHRVIDGVAGAQWLQTFKDLIENPMKLLL